MGRAAGTGSPNWDVLVKDYYITPNPSDEHIQIPSVGEARITELVIDMVCVPEPATMCLLGIGGLAMLRRRRRRKR